METLSSSAELDTGPTMSKPTTGMSARRPKLPTRAKPLATVNSPAYATTFYSISSPPWAEYENLNFFRRRAPVRLPRPTGRNCKTAADARSPGIQNKDLPHWLPSCKSLRLVSVEPSRRGPIMNKSGVILLFSVGSLLPLGLWAQAPEPAQNG